MCMWEKKCTQQHESVYMLSCSCPQTDFGASHRPGDSLLLREEPQLLNHLLLLMEPQHLLHLLFEGTGLSSDVNCMQGGGAAPASGRAFPLSQLGGGDEEGGAGPTASQQTNHVRVGGISGEESWTRLTTGLPDYGTT